MRVAWITASPRIAATGALTTVRLAGGGSSTAYYRDGNHYRAGVAAEPRFRAQLGFDENGWTGGTAPTTGAIVFKPAGSAPIAELAALVWTDAPITIERGPEGGPYSTILIGTVADHAVTENTLVLAIADLSKSIDRPLLTARFAGNGAAEGGAEASGRPKRRSWGRVYGVEGRVLDKAYNIFEFGDPSFPWQAIDVLRDKGRAASPAPTVLPWQGSIAATLTALKNAACVDGSGIVAPSICCAKWWTQPAGKFSADIRGEIGASYVETAPEIAARIVAAGNGPPIANVSAMAAIRGGAAGCHVGDDNETTAQALDRLLLGVSLSWVLEPAGAIRLREWTFSGPVETLTSRRANRLRSFGPVKARRLGYQRSHCIHSDGEISAAVQAGDVAGLGDLAGQDAVDFETQLIGPGKPESGAQRNVVAYYKRSATQPATPSGAGAPAGWADKPSSAWTLALSAGVTATDANTSFTKTGGVNDAWDVSFRSSGGYAGDITVSFVIPQTNKNFMVGLNSDPATNDNYTSIDFAVWVASDGNLYISQNGSISGVQAAYSAGNEVKVSRSGSTVTAYKNGVALAVTAAIAAATPLYLDSSLATAAAAAANVRFGPSALIGSDPVWVTFGDPTLGNYSVPVRYTDAEPYADVTANHQHTLTVAPAQEVQYDYTGTSAPHLPKLLQNTMKRAGTDVTASTSFTYVGNGCGVTATGLAAGQVRLLWVNTTNAYITVSAEVPGGAPAIDYIPVKRTLADPPAATGGSAGATGFGPAAVNATITDTSHDGTPQVLVTGQMLPNSAGQIRMVLNADYSADPGQTAAIHTKAQKSTDGASWSDIGLSATGTTSTGGYYDTSPGQVPGIDNWIEGTPGSVAANALIGGFTVGTPHHLRWIAYKSGSQASVGVSGSASGSQS